MPEFDVAALSDLPESEPVKVDAGDRAVLLIRRGDDVTALTHECPHLGLPLSKGVVRGNMLICAFHHACFDARTGAQAEPPGKGDLQRFAVAIRDGRVVVDVPEDAPAHPLPAMARGGGEGRTFVIAGAGAAAFEAAATLRAEGFAGTIEMIAPDGPPLDRTMLSKGVLAGAKAVDALGLAPDPQALGATLVADRVVAVEPGCVTLASGGARAFDALLVAPGGVPRRLGIEGEELAGVHVLRSGAGCRGHRAAARRGVARGGDRRRVHRDGGGAEPRQARPVGDARHRARRCRSPGSSATTWRAPSWPSTSRPASRTSRRPRRPASRAATGWRQWSGRAADEARPTSCLSRWGSRRRRRRSTGCPWARTAASRWAPICRHRALPGVWVAGDCARAAIPFGPARIEHWRVACQHGARAARSMLGRGPDGDDIPFFWTALARQYRYLGHAEGWDRIEMDGDPSGPFLARYVKDGRVMAALTAGRDPELAALHLAMREAGGPVAA